MPRRVSRVLPKTRDEIALSRIDHGVPIGDDLIHVEFKLVDVSRAHDIDLRVVGISR